MNRQRWNLTGETANLIDGWTNIMLQWRLVPDPPEASSLRLEARREEFDLLFYVKPKSPELLYVVVDRQCAHCRIQNTFTGAIGDWRGFSSSSSFFFNNFTLKSTCKLPVLETHRQNSVSAATSDSSQKKKCFAQSITLQLQSACWRLQRLHSGLPRPLPWRLSVSRPLYWAPNPVTRKQAAT